MASLIQLTFAPRKSSSRRSGPSAEIIIFPGVRYERQTEPTSEKPKRKRKSRATAAKRSLVAR